MEPPRRDRSVWYVGVVLTTRRPGAETSTVTLRDEKNATVSSVSVAPTETTSGYAAGYSVWFSVVQRSPVVPQLPAALTTRTFLFTAYVTALRSAVLSNWDPSDMLMTFAP